VLHFKLKIHQKSSIDQALPRPVGRAYRPLAGLMGLHHSQKRRVEKKGEKGLLRKLARAIPRIKN